MDSLDFSKLTDEQLCSLIRAGIDEAFRRNAACVASVQHSYLSIAEKAVISREAIARERTRVRTEEAKQCEQEARRLVRVDVERRLVDERLEKERRSWARKKGFAQALAALGWDVKGDQLVCWMNDTTKEKRVFLQPAGFGNGSHATLYVTGNKKHPPNTVEISHRMDAEYKAAIPVILRAASNVWTSVKIDLATALAWDGEAEPPPTDEYVAARARDAVACAGVALDAAVASVGIAQ